MSQLFLHACLGAFLVSSSVVAMDAHNGLPFNGLPDNGVRLNGFRVAETTPEQERADQAERDVERSERGSKRLPDIASQPLAAAGRSLPEPPQVLPSR